MSAIQGTPRRVVPPLIAAGSTLVALAASLVFIFIVCRRPDISDPAVLATMPAKELRDAEIETFLAAAFRNAEKVTIQSEVRESDNTFRRVTVTDRETLDRLAASLSNPQDNEPAPWYLPYPGVNYVRVSFEGPYQPDFTFTSDSTIMFPGGGRFVAVPSPFAREIARLLDLEEGR